MLKIIWIQTGGCSGDSMALLCAEQPSLEDLQADFGVELLWHPSLTSNRSFSEVLDAVRSGRETFDVLCVEGSLLTGPNGSGRFDTWKGIPKINLVKELAAMATHVLAMGTCAAFGGVHAAPPNPADSTGLQFLKSVPGGLLGEAWRGKSGQPVINLAGCPTHPDSMTKILAMLAQGSPIELDHLNRPTVVFSSMVHQGCTRNEYHEYDIEDTTLGGRACLFFNLGCRGPQTIAPCNTELWNGLSSKTRAGVPCFGCTSPEFPPDRDLFATPKIGSVPKSLPLGVARARYLAYKNLAKAAAPERLLNRDMEP